MFDLEIKMIGIYNARRVYFGTAEMDLALECAFKFEKGLSISKNLIENKIVVNNLPSNIFMEKFLENKIVESLEEYFNSETKISEFLDGIRPGTNFYNRFVFRPKGDNPICVPIEVLRISDIQCERKSKPITATLDFGDYFKAFKVPIYDFICQEYLDVEFIKSPYLKSAVQVLVQSEEVKNEIKGVFEIGHPIFNSFKHEVEAS